MRVHSIIEGPSPELEYLPLEDGELYYSPQVFSAESCAWFEELARTIAWEQSEIHLFGKKRLIPRLNAWYGDEGIGYSYSGMTMSIEPWLPLLSAIKQRVQRLTGCEFNSVLANYYRDGQDSVAWHSDDEPELGRNPVIASVSLGAERVFLLRHKNSKVQSKNAQKSLKLPLADGSLLLMKGATQHNWQHQLPKVPGLAHPRINLTFRLVRA